MPRGMGKATDLVNNGPDFRPWTWRATDWQDREKQLHAFEWSSSRHKLRVLAIQGGKYVIADERGRFLKGPRGRERRFHSMFSAWLAADVWVGLA